jgi:CBS domain-containing protein
MLAKDVMSRDVTTIAPSASLADAARALVNSQATSLPVRDGDGRLMGILSEADVLRAFDRGLRTLRRNDAGDDGAAASAASQPRLVQDVMTRDVVAVEEDSGLWSVATLMLDKRLKRVPVVRGGEVVGVIRRTDLLKALLTSAAAAPSDPGRSRPAVEQGSSGDEELRSRVEAALSGGLFSSPWQPDVVAVQGVVHLWGRAPTRDHIARFQETAAAVPGVRSVTMHMHVAPYGRTGR